MDITYFQSNLPLTHDSFLQQDNNLGHENFYWNIIYQGISSATLPHIILSKTNQFTDNSFIHRDYTNHLNNILYSVLRTHHQTIWIFLEFIREFLSWTHTYKKICYKQIDKRVNIFLDTEKHIFTFKHDA